MVYLTPLATAQMAEPNKITGEIVTELEKYVGGTGRRLTRCIIPAVGWRTKENNGKPLSEEQVSDI
jgi:hypothetical protein